MTTKVLTGLENLLANHNSLVAKRKIGIVAHPASVTSHFVHILPALLHRGAEVEALFGPEHGFGGEAQDMEPVSDPQTGPMGIDLYSLYGKDEESLTPNLNVLQSLDALVVDLIDVGARYYTFVWTTILCLKACKKVGKQLIVLDRPNPLGGATVEGAPQDEGFLSFVGLRKVPVRHGLTVGEIVTMVAEHEAATDVLTVIPMKGWHRGMYYDETGLPWIAPSPNMPTLNTVVVYPGSCLLEATWCSEARGTTLPFEFFGAPGINNSALCATLQALPLPGVQFRPISFKPMFQKHAGNICTGAQLHVTDRHRFLPFKTGVAIIQSLKQVAPELFQWRTDPYEFVAEIPAMDLLCGSSQVRQAIEQNIPLEDIAKTWHPGEREFLERKPHFHLY